MDAAQKRSVRSFTFKMLLGILIFSAVIGYVVYKNYLVFEHEMLEARATLLRDGPNMTLDQCVATVVDRVESCTKMPILCEKAVPRLMGTCLTARDRRAECQTFVDQIGTSKFGYPECRARGTVGRKHSSCGTAYNVFADFCKDNYNTGKS